MTYEIPKDLMDKYNIPTPRYTSYPPVPVWKGICEDEWLNSLKSSIKEDSSLALYIHVPFCQKLCAFCGCQKMITRDLKYGREYLDALKREWLQLYTHLNQKPKLKEMHLGGGSPSWLPPTLLDELLEFFLCNHYFEIDRDQFELSIELDPRTTTKDQIQILKKHRFTRVSLGIQDTNDRVLNAIKRNQPYTIVEDLMAMLHEIQIPSINLDLIYGLPYQTLESIEQTLHSVLKLNPHRLAFYSYAHLPSLKPAQKIVERHGLPDPFTKRKIYEHGRKILIENNFFEIGLDHFAKPSDSLYQSYLNGKLHRNFMGHTTLHSSTLIGLGPSALSSTNTAFAQNEKEYRDWHKKVVTNSFPLFHGHQLNSNEQIKQKMIINLMCKFETQIDQNLLPDWQKQELESLQDDGLIIMTKNSIKVSSLGKIFIRNVCKALDDTFKPYQTHSSSI